MIAEKLRKSIFQAAIQGKLTEQLPEDGDARELLSKILVERSRLVEEGKIKIESSHLEINENEIPFDIPSNWCWVRFGDIFSIGSSRRVHQRDWRSKGVPFYRAREIAKLADQGFVDNELFIDNEFYERLISESGVPQTGDMMVTGVGTLGKTYLVKSTDKFYYKDASVLCVKNYADIIPEYFKLFMESQFMIDQINSNSGGTTVSTLTIARFNKYLFLLPPIPEQKRIVEKIDVLLSQIDELKNDEIQLDVLQKSFPKKIKDSLLYYAIQGKLTQQLPDDGDARDLLKKIRKEKSQLIKEGKIKKEKTLFAIIEGEMPFDIPGNWCWSRLGDVITLKSGQDMAPNKYHNKAVGTPYITGASNFENGKIILNRWTNSPKSIALKDDLLITCKGTIGEMAFMIEDSAHIARQVMALRPIADVNIGYIQCFLSVYVANLKSMAKSMIPGISRDMILDAVIPIPPLSEQRRIVQQLEKLLPLCETLQ